MPSVIFECVFLRCREDSTSGEKEQNGGREKLGRNEGEEAKNFWRTPAHPPQPEDRAAGESKKNGTRRIVGTSDMYQCVCVCRNWLNSSDVFGDRSDPSTPVFFGRNRERGGNFCPLCREIGKQCLEEASGGAESIRLDISSSASSQGQFYPETHIYLFRLPLVESFRSCSVSEACCLKNMSDESRSLLLFQIENHRACSKRGADTGASYFYQ